MASTWDVSTSIYKALSMQVCFPVLVTLFRRYVSCNWDILGGRSFAQTPNLLACPRGGQRSLRIRPVCVGYVMDEMALGQGFPRVLAFAAVNPLNVELNPICYLLALLAHHFLHVGRKRVKSLTLRVKSLTLRVKSLTLRLLMSYIYIWSTYS